MAEIPPFPPIEPTTFDLIVIGTGLPESILASAASSVNKTVLHLDPNPFYGSHFSSLPLPELTQYLISQSQISSTTRPMYSQVDINSQSPLDNNAKFILDLNGPRVLFCADAAIDVMLRSNASQYMEFKNVEASYICDGMGKLRSVPDSRSAIFKDRSMPFAQKNQLMSFFKMVQAHLDASEVISKQDLDTPFVEFLNKIKLPPEIKSIILYAIAMADYDQDIAEVGKYVLKTRDGIDRLALYHSSVGRFPNALGALIYPIYGQGELPQAFCRRAAVKGCIYVLRMSVVSLLMDEGSGSYKGVKLSSGQELFSHQLVLDPSLTVSSPSCNSPSDILHDSSHVFGLRDLGGKVARGICISKGSIKRDVSSCLVFYPPRSLYPEQVTSVRILQIGSNLAVCPSGMFVFYLSALCEDDSQGKKALHAAINALFSIPVVSGIPENSLVEQSENTEEVKPTLLWSASYIQELTVGSLESVRSTPMPDESLNYNSLVTETKKLFHMMYPNEEFFPETSVEKIEDDNGTDLELES